MDNMKDNHYNDEDIIKIVDKIPETISSLPAMAGIDSEIAGINTDHLIICDQCMRRVWHAYETRMELSEKLDSDKISSFQFIKESAQFLIHRISSGLNISEKIPALSVRGAQDKEGFKEIQFSGVALEIPGVLYKAKMVPDIDGYNLHLTFQGKISGYAMIEIIIDEKNYGASSIYKNRAEVFLLNKQLLTGSIIKIAALNESESRLILEYKNG